MATIANSRTAIIRLSQLSGRRFITSVPQKAQVNIYGVTGEKVVSWLPTGILWGVTGFVTLVYATDWKRFVRVIPFVKNRLPPPPPPEEDE